VADLIRDIRTTKSLSRAEVADKADIAASTMWLVEQGAQGFSASTMFKVLSALGVKVTIEVGDFKQVIE
jgi:transcriptional regulator with XRE-family HTH domain